MTRMLQITFTNKPDRSSPWGIKSIGGEIGNGRVWEIPRKEAIECIERGLCRFYVARPNAESVWVVVATNRFGNKYLKTETDGDRPDEILNLPDTPEIYALAGE